MKKSRLIGILVGLMIIPLGVYSQIKIGYIDSNRIMQEYEEVRGSIRIPSDLKPLLPVAAIEGVTVQADDPGNCHLKEY